jgi:hypothetical protein
MSYRVLNKHQLEMLVPKLAEVARSGFVAAYEGPGGVFAVYSPPVPRGMELGAKPVHIVTYTARTTTVQMSGKRWDEASANMVAQALAMATIEARKDGTVMVVEIADVDRVLAGTA